MLLRQGRGCEAAQQIPRSARNDTLILRRLDAKYEGPQILSNLRAACDAGPISRILYSVSAATVIPLGRPSLDGSSDLPGSSSASSQDAPDVSIQVPSLFGLAPCGVCHAPPIAARAVRSYRTFSPLPRACARGGIFSVALSVERP